MCYLLLLREIADYVNSEDVQKYSARIRESLRELNFKENSYILIADKVPREHRGSTSLAFLQSIPWIAVFDLFDPSSREDGLHYIFNETSDSARATVKELGDFKNIQPGEDMSTRGTTWIFRDKSMHESDWVCNSKDSLYRALSAYKERSPTGRIHCVFLAFGDESSEEMADVVESSFSIIGRHAGRYITIISEKKEIINGIVRYSKPGIRKDVTNSSLSGFPWKLFKSNVKDMLGPTHFHEPGATTELPYFAGKTMPVLNKRLNSLTDLEMYFPYPSLPDSVSEIEKARDNFYKGGVVNQLNLFHQHDIERTHQMDLTSSIDHYLKDLSKASSDMSSHVETVTLRYEPGSGATTLCRRILWNKKSTYRCAVVKAITPDTDYQIEVLYSFLFNADMPYQPPVLILVDNFGEQDVRQLMDKVSDRKVKCVFLNAVPIAKSSESGDENVAELRQLDKTEIKRVKQVLVDVTSEDDSRREAAEKVLEREKRFIWLGLELFGRDYFDIKQRLSDHIKHIISKNLMDESKDFYQMILRFSCLLDYYSKGRSIFPHPCATDILFQGRGPSAEPIDYIEVLHHKFGGLLLEGFNESNGCHGWRPAHALVGEVVRKEMDLLSVTKELLVKMNGGYSYAKKYLISDAVTVCLEREKKYDVRSDSKIDAGFALETGVDDDISGILEVRTRYSPLIKDINLNPDPEVGVDNALDILITLNENVTTDQHKARTWQQIARVIAYEIGMKKVSSANLQIGRVKRLVGPSAESGKSLTHGFEVAHLAIDQAIKIQESYVHHLVTKGAFFMAELRELEKRSCIGTQDVAAMIKQAITTCKEGIRVYDNALRKSVQDYHNGYLHSMVGKIQMVVRLLEVFKRLPYFTQHTLGPDESFKSYMNEGVHPDELNGLFDEDELTYLLSLRGTAVELSNDLFEEIKLRRTQTYKSYEIHELNNVKLRALKLRRLFYDVTKLDRTHLSHDLGYHEDIVNDIFSQYDETPFSSWKRLSNSKVAKIYQTLHSAVRKMPISSTGMLVYARAALQVQEKPTMSELAEYVDYWCQRCPKSVWAHLFNYMIHFPVPNFPISKNVTSVKSSIAMCNNSSQIRKSQRRSGAEYLLGKGMGLDAIVRPHELSESGQDMNGTKFWQSYTVVERLERLLGRKVRQGVLSYRDIEILFDNERYPKDSRDDLWFCLGFTVNGPYAYDPINNDGYQTLKKLSCRDTKLNDRRQEPTNSLDSSSSATETRSPAKSGDKCTTSRSKAKTTYTPPTRKTPTPISNLSAKHTGSSVVSESKKELPTTSNSASETPASTHGQTSRESWKTCPKLAIAIRSSGGSQVIFRPTQVDKQGRVHHGTPVRGSRKSADCFTHKSGKVPQNCNFAHFWCGDTLQFICTKCTDEHKVECKDKNKHASFIHNLGAYRNRDGEDWRLKK